MANYNVNLTFTADTKAAKAQLQSLKADLQALSSGANLDVRADTMSKQLSEASQAARELKAHLEAATNVQTGNLDFTKLSKSLKDSGKTLSDYGQQLKVLGATGDQAFVQLTRAVMNAEVPLRKTSDLVDKMLVTFKNNARWMASSAVLNGITQSLSSAYSYAQNLNSSLNDIRIVTGYNIDKMKEFAVQANKAAKALSTSTTSYTNASLIYFQQGLSDKEVKERADVTVKLANVTGESTEAISEQLTAVWNNFYDGSKSLEYYADVMTKLGAATASSSEEISQGLEKFAAVADTVGLSYEYAASALATVTATTRESADVVGTAFKTLFSRIQGLNLGETQDDGTTLNKYSQALASVGVSVKDASGNLRDMDDILNDLGSKWDNLAKTQQVALAQTIGGARQYSNFIALMDNWDYFQENLTTAMGSTGALQEQADIYAESWEAAQMRVKASAQAIYSDLIDDEFFIKMLNSLDKVLEGVDKLIGSLGGLKGVLSSISVIVLSLGKNTITKTLNDAFYNVGMLTESGRKRVLEDKNRQVTEAITQLKVADSGDAEETARLKGNFMHEAKLQNEAQIASATASDSALMIIKSNLETVQQLSQQAQEAVKASRENRTATEEYLRKLVGIRKEVPVGARGKVNEHISAYASALQQSNVLYSEGSHAWTTLQDYKDDQEKRLQVFDEMALGSGLGAKDKEALRKALETSYEQFEAKLAELDGQAIKNLQEKHNQIVADLKKYHTVDKATNKEADLNEFESDNTNAAADMDVVRVQAAYQKAVDETTESIDKAAKKSKEWSDIIVESATLMTGAISVYNGITGIIDAIKDDDLSGWEKFTSILTSLAFALPMMLNGLKSLRSLLQKETLARIANTAAAKAEAAAVRKSNIEKGVEGAKNKANNVVSNIKDSVAETNENEAKQTLKTLVKKAKNKWGSFTGSISSTWNENAWKGLSKEAQEEYLKQFTTTNTHQLSADEVWAGLTDEQKNKYLLDNKIEPLDPKKWRKLNNAYVGQRKGVTKEQYNKEYNDYAKELANQSTQKAKEAAQNEFGTVTETTVNEAGAKSMAGKAAATNLGTNALAGALIAAGIAVAVGTVYALKTAYDQANTAAEKAAEHAQALSNAYQSAQTAYTDLKNTVESWTEADKILDSLQVGTTEWKEALIEANEEALKLIDTYEDLKYTVDANGRISIDEDSLDDTLDEMLKEVERAQGNAALAKTMSLSAENEAKRINFNREYSNADTLAAAGQEVGYTAAGAGAGTAAGAAVGGAIGVIVGGAAGAAAGGVGLVPGILVGLKTGAGIGAAIGGGVGTVAGAASGIYTGQESSYEKAKVEDLVEQYMSKADGNAWMETSDDFVQAAKDLGLTAEDEIDALRELIETIANNTEQAKLLNGIVGAQKGDEYIKEYGTSAEKEAWSKLTEKEKQLVGGNISSSKELEDRVEELTSFTGKYAGGFWSLHGMSDKKVHEQYAQDVLGWDIDDANILYENRNGKGYFKNTETGEEYELDDTSMRQELAYNQAYREIFGKNITYSALNGISDLRTMGYDVAIANGLDKSSTLAVGNALTAGKEDMAASIAALSADERQALIDLYNNNSEALKDIDYTGLGFESFEGYMYYLGTAINEWDAASAATAATKRREEEYEDALSNGATSLEISTEALEHYTNAIVNNNGALEKGSAAAVEYATAQAKLRTNFSALSDVIGQNITDLADSKKGTLAYSVALGKVANSIGELFGVTPDTTFVEQYLDDIINFVNTGEGGAELQAAIAENWLSNNSDIEDDSVKQMLREAGKVADEMGLSSGQTQTLTNEAAFNKSGLESLLADGTLSSSTLQAYMNAKGFSVELDETGKTIVGITKTIDEVDFEKTATELLESLDDISARYKDIERSVSNIDYKLSVISKKSENAYGSKRLAYLEKEIALTDELIEKDKQKQEEAAIANQEDRDDLAQWVKNGLNIDNETGEILNYQEIWDKLGATERENFQKAVEQYETSLQDWRDAVLSELEHENEKLSLEWENINYKIELKLEVSDKEQQYLDWLISTRDDPLTDAAENLAAYTKGVASQMDALGAYEEEYTAIQTKLKEGQELNQYEIDFLNEYQTKLYDATNAALEYGDTVKDYLVTAFESLNEELDESLDKLDAYSKILSSYKNIIDLTGRDNINMFDETYLQLLQLQQDNTVAQLNVKRQEWENNKAALKELQEQDQTDWSEDAIAKWKEAVKEIEQQTLESETEFLSSWEATLESAAQIFESTVTTIVGSFEDEMTDIYGSYSRLQEAYNQQSTLASQYVTEYEKIYNLSKLSRNLQSSIDDTSNIKAKQKLRALQEQINELNEADTELSKYQLDYLQKQYDLELALITLEESQNAKSEVRLRRDAEGNYAYVFTANAEVLSQAQQSYEDQLYAIAQLNQEYIKENSDAIIQIQVEYANAMASIKASDYATSEEYEAALRATTEYYQEMMEYRTSELGLAMDHANALYEMDVANYNATVGSLLGTEGKWIKSFDDTLLSLSGKETTLSEYVSTWQSNVSSLENELKTAYEVYTKNINSATEAAGTSLGNFNQTYSEKVGEIDGETQTIVNGLGSISEIASKAFGNLVNYAGDAFNKYSKKISTFTEANGRIIQSINDVLEAMAQLKDFTETEADDVDTTPETEDKKSITTWSWNSGGASLGKVENTASVSSDILSQITGDYNEETQTGYKGGNYYYNGNYVTKESLREAGVSGASGVDYFETKGLLATTSGAEKLVSSEQVATILSEGTLSNDGSTISHGGVSYTIDAIEKLINGTFQTWYGEDKNLQKLLSNLQSAQNGVDVREPGSVSVNEDAYKDGLLSLFLEDEGEPYYSVTPFKNSDEMRKAIPDNSLKIVDAIRGGNRVYFRLAPVSGNYTEKIQQIILKAIGDKKITPPSDCIWVDSEALNYDQGWVKDIYGFNTGGYTGDWSGADGRLALLHQKEIVLNKDDTANLLSTVDMVRNIARVIDLNAASSANALGTLTASLGSAGAQTIEQKVEITASFPNATNHSEIEQAFTTLINEASQFANRKKI